MSNMLLTILLFGGVAAIFAAGSLAGHLFKLDHKYDEMMDAGGNVPGADDRHSENNSYKKQEILTKM
jgi:hypothetical protein